MPGPQDPSDQAADAYGRGQNPEHRPDLRGEQADRPARGSLTDLRQRLERLPPGHPSSPRNDDGSRKPPVIRLKDLELPLPGDNGRAETDADHTHAGAAYADATVASEVEAAAGEFGAAEMVAGATVASEVEAAATETHASEPPASGAPEPEADGSEIHAREAHPGQAYGRARHAGQVHQTELHAAESGRTWTSLRDSATHAPGWPERTLGEPANDQAQSRPNGSWEWKGMRLTPRQCKIAEEVLNRCRAAEGRTVFGTYSEAGLTPAVRRVEAQLEHGQLVPETEKFALKNSDRFKEKLAQLIARNPDKSADELATEIHDSVRYTFLFEEEHYFEGTWQAHAALENQGYELEVRRNSWENPEYKGVNTRWRDADHDVLFEVQFHTPSSWDAKQRTHNAYERIADPRTSPRERAALRSQQAEVSAKIPVPPRCNDIGDYRKEGH